MTRELLANVLLHGDVTTVMGRGLADYTREPWLDQGALAWRAAPAHSGDPAAPPPFHVSDTP